MRHEVFAKSENESLNLQENCRALASAAAVFEIPDGEVILVTSRSRLPRMEPDGRAVLRLGSV